MANRTAALYIRTKSGYAKRSKRLLDLPEGQTYQLFWYDGTHRKPRNSSYGWVRKPGQVIGFRVHRRRRK